MNKTLPEIGDHYRQEIAKANSLTQLQQIQTELFGRKQGVLTTILRNLKTIIDPAGKKQLGQEANTLKQKLTELWLKKQQTLRGQTLASGVFDVTLPAQLPAIGHIHPLRRIQEELIAIFQAMSFMVVEGNELETEDYCFTYLNIPPTHPARDLQDTFYVAEQAVGVKRVMRTHTSNMQVRVMQQQSPPLRAVVPGRVFRHEAVDASHEHTFYQMEGFVVDTTISIAQLTYVLRVAMSRLLQQDIRIRLRPGYFPYVEPGFEADCSCTQCHGQGCAVCKHTGWVEMLGCGMIHPQVFASAGYPAGRYTGFAFGIGLNRLAMLKYGIDHINYFMSGDVRFLEQF